MNFLSMFGILIAFASVLFLAYVTTRLVGGKTKRSMNSKYISIVDTISLGLDKHIHLIRVENQFMLISTSGKSIDFLTEVKIEEFNESNDVKGNSAFDFKSIFEKYVNAYKEKRNVKSSKKTRNKLIKNEKSDIEFSDEGVFKSNLNKLKGITEDFYKNSEEDGDDNKE